MKIAALGCLVTGASQGIGRAVAHELGRRACRLALVGRRRATLELVRQEVEELGGQAASFVADVTNESAIIAAANEADGWCGGLRAAFVNAGAGVHGGALAVPLEAVRAVNDVNFLGAVATTRAALPHLERNAPGVLVASVSIAALMPGRGLGAYGASKAALIQYLRCLRLEMAGRKVRVCWVAAGPADTALVREAGRFEKLPRLARRVTPLMQPEQVAGALVRQAEGRAAQLVVPRSAAFFAAIFRHFPRLSELGVRITGAGAAE